MRRHLMKHLHILLALTIVFTMLCSCSNAKAEQTETVTEGTGFSKTAAVSQESETSEAAMTENTLASVSVPIETILYSASERYITNPYMGLCAWAGENPEAIKQKISLVYVDVTWAQLEPERGNFRFEELENRCRFSYWKQQGVHAVFRLMLDEPTEEAHMDIPQWLYEMTGDGCFYETDYGKGYSPNYANEVLISEHERVIRVLGEYLGRDDFVSYVQLGSLGHWGEWHVHTDVAMFPTMEICKKYFLPYTMYFKNATLMLRRPFSFTNGYRVGLYNDECCDQESTELWLQWIREGGEYNDTGEENALMPMTDAYKTAAIGGEITSFYQDLESLLLTEKDRIGDAFRRSHQSWIGPYSFSNLDTSGSEALQNSFNEVMKNVGYRLYVQKVERYEDRFEVTIANNGAAPFYYNWATVFLIKDTNGGSRKMIPGFDIRTVLPGESKVITLPASGPVSSIWIKVESRGGAESIDLCMDVAEEDNYYLIYQAK